jgi:alcohol dehydrogenase class IV
MDINEEQNYKTDNQKSCNQKALEKYSKASAILSGTPTTNIVDACRLLIEVLEEYIHISKINRLGYYQIDRSDLSKIVSKTSNKSNPIKLTREQMAAILENRI